MLTVTGEQRSPPATRETRVFSVLCSEFVLLCLRPTFSLQTLLSPAVSARTAHHRGWEPGSLSLEGGLVETRSTGNRGATAAQARAAGTCLPAGFYPEVP